MANEYLRERDTKLRRDVAIESLVSLLLIFHIVSPIADAQSVSGPNPPTPVVQRIDPADFDAIRSTKIVTAVRTSDVIVLDGVLDEPAWSLAEPATDFIQRLPRLGEPATDPTEIRFLYDDNNIYFGVTARDSDAGNMVVNDLTEDFNFLQSDAVTFILDTLNDDRSAFVFVTNPAGARYDGQIANDAQNFNVDWDGVWDVKATRSDEGWVAEFAIPFKTLRFSSDSVQEWGLNMTRAIRARNEESVWSPIPFRYRATRVSLAGTLAGIENIEQGMNLSVKPYVIGGFTQARTAGALLGDLDTNDNFDGGVDAKYSLTPSLTLDTTYRTDFAQVEADQQQVNLSRFSLFFPEKRDFFLENSGTFVFGPGGGSGGQGGANLVPFFSRRIGLSDDGMPTPIIGGARLTGRIGDYDVGALAMKTEEHGTTPSNNFVVGRVKRNLLTSSWIGALATSRDSSIDGDYNRVYGADANFRFYSNRLEFDGYILKSDTPGLKGKNLARRVQAGWRDDEWIIGGEYNEYQTNFNPEMGFIRRRNVSHYAGEFSFNPRLTESAVVRNLVFATNFNYFENGTTGQIETRSEDFTAGIQFENNGSASLTMTRTLDRLTESDRIQGIPLRPGDYLYTDYAAGFRTDGTEVISGNASINWGEFWDGTRTSFNGGLVVKPNEHLNVGLSYSRNRLDLSNGTARTDLVGTRLVYGFTSRVFLNAFVQYNSTTREVSSNIRFKFNYRPLSDFFIVYNDRRDTLNGLPIDRTLIVKFTRLLSF